MGASLAEGYFLGPRDHEVGPRGCNPELPDLALGLAPVALAALAMHG